MLWNSYIKFNVIVTLLQNNYMDATVRSITLLKRYYTERHIFFYLQLTCNELVNENFSHHFFNFIFIMLNVKLGSVIANYLIDLTF